MKLLIFYLTDMRRHFTFEHYVNLLNESKMKHMWKIIILTHEDDMMFYKDILNKTDIEHDEFRVDENNNYMNKVALSISYAKHFNIPYMMKCDNDIFIRGRTLDYMINNLHLLDESNNLTLGPTLSSGIPAVEYFTEDFLDINDRKRLYDIYLKTEFTDIWGATYTHHNKFTKNATEWNGREFFNDVKQNAHYYKGIHPIRINVDAIKYLNNLIVLNKEKYYEDKELSIIKDNISPYLCDSIFCIKRDTYEKIIYNLSLYVDHYDEVPLNRYAWANSMTHLFVKNGFGIHMCYNTINNNIEYEEDFCSKFF